MASGDAWPNISNYMYTRFVELLVYEGIPTVGELWTVASNFAKTQYNAGTCWIDLTNIYITFGDPSLQYYVRTPTPLLVTHDGAMGVGQTIYEVTVEGADNAACTLYDGYYDIILGTGCTDASGHVTLVLDEPPEVVSELTLTVFARHAQTVQSPVGLSGPTYVVKPDGTGDFPTIQDAIEAASNGDVIGLVTGTYSGPGNRDLLMRGKDIVIRWTDPFPLEECVIDCDGSAADPHTGFYFIEGEGPGAMLEGIRIVGGHMPRQEDGGEVIPGRGGAIVCGEPTLGSASVAPSLVRCAFEDNYAEDYGGAVYSGVNASPLLRECTFVANEAGAGGGVYHEGDSECVMKRCLFTDNYSTQDGAAVACTNGSMEFCTIAWNMSENGASGIDCGSVRLKNCTFANNGSTDPDAGVFTAREGLMGQAWEAIVIAGNDRVFTGECVYPPAFSCTAIYKNEHGDWTTDIEEQLWEDGNISYRPYFCDEQERNYAVHEGSPCLPGTDLHPEGCGLIGAWYAGCSTVDVPELAAHERGLRLSMEPNPGMTGVGARVWACPG